MKTVKLTFAAAAFILGLSNVSVAGTPKEEAKDAKSETPAKTEASAGSVKWFHFNGVAGTSDETDPLKYSEVAVPECDQSDLQYRCDIKIMSQGTTPDRPNLSTLPQEETTRSNPNP